MAEGSELVLCECREGCVCESKPGFAMHLIERDGVRMRVCTRCHFGDDKEVAMFSVNMDKLTLKDVIESDPIAAFMLMFRDEESAEQGSAEA